MSGPVLHLSGFAAHASAAMPFSQAPRLSIRAAFNQISKKLPPQGCVLFHHHDEGISADIYPFCGPEEALKDHGPEPTHYAYRLYPAHQSAYITRIKAEQARRGAGSAMMASQYPFMQEMGVRFLSVITHAMGEGFYHKLGFVPVTRLPEKPAYDNVMCHLMRLDLQNPQQRARFEAALAKTKPLVP